MNIEVITPVNIELQKYIDCFYILTHSKSEGKTTYFTFPSMFSILSISSNVEIVRGNNFIKVSESSSPKFSSDLEVKFTNPLLIQYKGEVKEITTYFKPLGLNMFLDENLNYYCKKGAFYFVPFSDYNDTMQSILHTVSTDTAIEKLEKYWLNKLNVDLNFQIEQAIKNIIEHPERSIASIAENSNLSHKTLIAHFNKHICKTPTQFRKVVRFRKALENKKDNNLTQLSFLSNYFDQAHMIKDFHDLTGHIPKDFFKNLSTIDEKINWIFTKR